MTNLTAPEPAQSHRAVEPPEPDRPPLPAGALAGEVAVVTGGGSGLGLAAAVAFAQAGASVALFGRTAETLAVGAASLAEAGARVESCVVDVRDAAAIEAAFDYVAQVLGRATILSNNAGGNYPVLAERISPGQWRSITAIAIDGTMLCSAAFARRRIAAGGGGAIVNNSAHYIEGGFPGDAHSAAAKSAVAALSASLAREWHGHGIRVNCIAAGFFPHARSGGDGERAERLGRMIPAGRVGRMREYGWLTAFLASPFAAGINGQTLVIDGGDRLRRALTSPAFVPPRERAEIWGVLP